MMLPDHENGFHELARRGRHGGPDDLVDRVEATLAQGGSRPRAGVRANALLIAACLVVVGLVVVGVLVRGAGDSGQRVASDGSSGVPEQDLDLLDSWVAALAAVPADPDSPLIAISVVDQARVREHLDLTAPGDAASDEEVLDHLQALARPLRGSGAVASVAGVGAEPTPAEMRDELGFDQRSLDRVVEVLDVEMAAPGARTVTHYQGRFAADEIDSALRSHDGWSENMTTADHAGSTYYRWDDTERIEMDRATPLRPLGRPFQLAIAGPTRVVLATDEAHLRRTLETVDGSRPSVLTHQDILLAAEIADLHQLVAGTLVIASSDRAERGTESAGHVGALTGIALDDSGVTHYYVALHERADAARSRLAGFEAAADELAAEYGIDVEVRHEREAVVVAAYGYPSGSPPIGQWFDTVEASPPPATAPADAPSAYVDAFEEFIECLDDADVHLDGLTWDEDRARFDYSFSTEDLADHDRCYGRHLRSADMARQPG